MREILVVAIVLFSIVGCKTEPGSNVELVSGDTTVVAANPFDSISALINESPNNADLLHERGKMFIAAGDLSVALGDLGRAIMIDSTQSDYFLTLSDIYFKGNKPAKSMTALKRAGAIAPNDPEVPLRLAEFYLYIQNYTEAVNATNEALALDNRNDRAYFLKGFCYKEVGDTMKAVEQFQRAVENNADYVDAYVELAILYDIKGDPVAEQYYQNALKVEPDSKEALYGLGLHYQDTDRLNEAMQTYTKLVQFHPDYSSAFYNMGFINYEFVKDRNQALSYFDAAVQVNPDYISAIYMRGLCFEALGDVSKAKREYQFALQKDPGFQLALDGLKRLL
ncbi:MAG: tetratricopeptide (TPR) repeat protein [Granulosicoccus sp.]|jgi:tetratricopeptide (TPR) repeat protein